MRTEGHEGALAFISMGSNIDPESNLPLALRCLAGLGRVLRISNVYQNPAKGPLDQPDFLNAAVLMETGLTPHELRSELRTIEAKLGRQRPSEVPGMSEEELKYMPRTIDLDICLHGNSVVRGEDLEIPDPEIHTRSHIAIPLAELAPDFPHPETGEQLGQIAASLLDQPEMLPRPDIWVKGEPHSITGATAFHADDMGDPENEN